MKKMRGLILVVALLLTFGLAACEDSEETFNTDSNITVNKIDTTSGTRAGFMAGIGFDEAEASDSVLVEGFVIKDNTGIMTSMQTDEFGIGYV